MRLNRGKTIIESEQYKNLNTKEEKVNYLSSLSLTELEDTELYYTNKQNAQKIAEDTLSIIFQNLTLKVFVLKIYPKSLAKIKLFMYNENIT